MLCRRNALLLALGVLTGCGSPDTSEPLPDAEGLVSAAADNLEQLRDVRFTFGVSGKVPGLAVREVDGVAKIGGGPSGWAAGKADVQRNLRRDQYRFLLEGQTLSLTDSAGQVSRGPVPRPYAPAAVLGAGGGLHQLLTAAGGLRTETKEAVHDVATFRVTGTLRRDAIARLIPGVHADVVVKFWISQSRARELRRVWVQVPPRQPNEGAVMLELGLSEHNTAVPP